MPVLTPADLEALSAYLDNELDPAHRADLERRLAAEPDLRAELDALRAVVAQLHAAPLLRAPHDFRLDPAVYGRRRTTTPLRRVTRWSSAVSALAAVIVLALGVAGLLNRSQIVPGAASQQYAAREAQATEADLAAEASDAIALAATPLPTPAPFGTDQEAPAEMEPLAAPPGLATTGEDGAAAEPSLEGAQNAAGETAGFAPPAPSPTGAAFGQSADVAAGGVSSPKETPAGQGGGVIAAQPAAAPPQTSAVPDVALDAQEETEAPAAALSAPWRAQPHPAGSPNRQRSPRRQRSPARQCPRSARDRDRHPGNSGCAMVPTATSLPAPTLAPAPPPSVDEAPVTAPGTVDPALWFGAGLALLALAGVLYALSRR